MGGLFTSYLMLVGTLTAATQIARGVVRGIGKLLTSQPVGALAEAAGGLVSPLRSACAEVRKLGEDVRQTVATVTAAHGRRGEQMPTLSATCPRPTIDDATG